MKQLASQARFGEMTTLSMGTKTWVLLNSSRVVDELLAKRADIIHERPSFPVAGNLVSHGNKRLVLQKTQHWKPGRRLLARLMNGSEARSHGRIVEDASLGLLKACLTKPSIWV